MKQFKVLRDNIFRTLGKYQTMILISIFSLSSIPIVAEIYGSEYGTSLAIFGLLFGVWGVNRSMGDL